MKQKILTGIIVASLGLSQYSNAQEWTVVNSDAIDPTVAVDESQNFISFFMRKIVWAAPITLNLI